MSTPFENARLGRLHDSVLAEMIGAVDRSDYPRTAIHALNRLVPVDAGAMYVYSGDTLDYFFDKELTHMVDERFWTSYRDETYRINPFFLHHQSGLASGIYTMRQLAKSRVSKSLLTGSKRFVIDEHEEIGYLTHGFPKRCTELAIAVRVAPTQTIHLALYRSGCDVFYPSELAALSALSASFSALFKHYWLTHRPRVDQASDESSAAHQALQCFDLSTREKEVILMDLDGFNAETISTKLGISETTVKTHRKRAFAKMGIKTKIDLFTWILRRLSA